MIDLKNQGLRVEFLKEAKEMGYGFSPKEMLDLQHHGVDSGYLRKLNDSGFNALTAEKIMKLHDHGID